MPTPVNVSTLVPVLVTVTTCEADVVEICWATKVRLAGETLAKPWMPVEPSVTDCEPAPVAMTKEPVLPAVLDDANCTVTAQEAPTAMLVPQLVETKLKSLPMTEEAVGTVTLSAPMPVLLSVATAVVVEPTWVAAKVGVDRAAVCA